MKDTTHSQNANFPIYSIEVVNFYKAYAILRSYNLNMDIARTGTVS